MTMSVADAPTNQTIVIGVVRSSFVKSLMIAPEIVVPIEPTRFGFSKIYHIVGLHQRTQ